MNKIPYYTTIQQLADMTEAARLDMLDKEILNRQYEQALDRYVHLRTRLNQEQYKQLQPELFTEYASEKIADIIVNVLSQEHPEF